LTDTKRSNSVHVNASLGLFVVTSSSATTPPRTAINEISKPISFDSTPLARIKHTRFAQPEVNMIVPQFVQVPCADGMLQGMVYLPQLYNKKNTYPTVICTSISIPFHPTISILNNVFVSEISDVYGGPHVQLVRDEYSVTEMMRLQMLVNMGFVVGVVDGSGSWNRGLAFEGRIKHSMGQREVADQVALVNFLVAKGITDPNRVAVTGWSYGGYLSLMCLAQRADVFKVAICGAPVTNWETYDTGYTERYMDTPQDNAAGYESGNVLSYAHDFPEQEGRLVIAHGLLDENVHFTHTAALLDRLITLGKPYSLKLFPSERHGLRSITSSKYFHTLLATHLSANL
jgi:dipeptidyl aminopeptidase/acylaminoacyl peptidase